MAEGAPKPAFFKNLIPGSTSALCEKLNKLMVELTQGVADWVAFEYTEDGSALTPAYVTMLCKAGCGAGGGGPTTPDNPNMPKPTGVSASDGTFSNKVTVTWNEVVPPSGNVSNYIVYRSLSTNENPAAAVALKSDIPGNVFLYEDFDALPGTTYNYWVRATNGTETSSYAGFDAGHAGAFTQDLPAVNNLQATQGFSETTTGLIALVFTTPSFLTASTDVYRNTVNDSATAVKIHADVVCEDTVNKNFTPASGKGVNNGGGVSFVIYDQPPDGATKYFYWVKCKTVAPPRITPFSNPATGWVQIGTGDAGAVSPQKRTTDSTFTIPAGKFKMRFVMKGGGGGGSGANAYWGGGGGGGGDTVMGVLDVTPLTNYQFVHFDAHAAVSPPGGEFGNPPILMGDWSIWAGFYAKLTDLSTGTVRALAAGGYSGLWIQGGGGPGGQPAPDTNSSVLGNEVAIFHGKAGEAANGTRGGRGGESFGWFKTPPAHFEGGSFNGDSTEPSAGGGGSTAPGAGGTNGKGWIVFCFID